MPARASVEARERLRLFCGLPLPPEAAARLGSWQERALPAREGVRAVPRPNLHVTLAFLGGRPAGEVAAIAKALRAAAARVEAPSLTPLRYRETRSVGMIVFDDLDGRATRLAHALWKRLERLGVYEREQRRWLPHVTVVRFRGRPPRYAPELPELGAVSPSEAALYHSVLRPSGAQYVIVESVPLGGSTS